MAAPLLLVGREDALRAEITGVRAPQLRRLLDECERYRAQPLPTEHPLASITYLGPAAANLALAHRLTGQEHYLTELRRWLVPPLSFDHWGRASMPDHDLDAGWLLHGLSLALSWAGDALRVDEREALRDRLILQGERLHSFAVESEGRWWSSSYWQNHNWICWAGLATAGYVLAPEHQAATTWTDDARANFDTVLDMLPDDGSNAEGVVYWRYGVPWLVSYLDVLRAAEGIDWFARSAYLRNTFWYRLYQAAPDLERIVDHGDCHDRRSGHPVATYYKLASEYGIGEAQWLARQVAERFFWREAYESGVKPGVRAEAYQELLWFDPSIAEAPVTDLPTARFFGDLGLLSARTSWDADAVLLSFKASPGGGHRAWETSHDIAEAKGWTTLNAGHHHPDAGSFVLLGHGAYLAVDDGYASRKRAAHHSTVLVDGQGFVNEDRYHVYEGLAREHTARVLTTTLAEGWAHAVSETAAMYPPELGVRKVQRHVVLTPSGTLLVVDDLESDRPRTWTWLLQTDNPATDLGGGCWRADAGSGRLSVVAAAPDGTTDDVVPTAVQANPTASTPGLEIVTTQHTLRRVSAPTRRARFVHVLTPHAFVDDEVPRVVARVDDGLAHVEIVRGSVVEEVMVGLDGGATDGGDPALAGAELAGVGVAARRRAQ